MPKHTKVFAKTVQTALSRKATAERRKLMKAPRKTITTKKPRGATSLPEKVVANQFIKGVSPNPKGNAPGKRLLTRIREILSERSLRKDPVTKELLPNTRFDDVADAFVQQMEAGNFQHTKEFIEREEGKVRQDLGIIDARKLKLYENVPVDGPEAP